MSKQTQAAFLIVIAFLAVVNLGLAYVAEVQTTAIASQIGDEIRANPQVDPFSVAYGALSSHLGVIFRWFQLLGITIIICATICIWGQFSQSQEQESEKPTSDGPASQ